MLHFGVVHDGDGGGIGVPGGAPILHLLNFALLSGDDIFRQLTNFGPLGMLQGGFCHRHGPLMVGNHAVNKAEVVGGIGGAEIHVVAHAIVHHLAWRRLSGGSAIVHGVHRAVTAGG